MVFKALLSKTTEWMFPLLDKLDPNWKAVSKLFAPTPLKSIRCCWLPSDLGILKPGKGFQKEPRPELKAKERHPDFTARRFSLPITTAIIPGIAILFEK